MKITLLMLLLMLTTVVTKGQVKLIMPGEHLGFELVSFDHQQGSSITTISQGETWNAVYIDNGAFKIKTEKLSWDTAQNFSIQSNAIKQPLFYVQGLKNLVASGPGTELNPDDYNALKPFRWTLNNTSYVALYKDDENCSSLVDNLYKIICTNDEIALFKGVSQEQVDKLQLSKFNRVRLLWTGDLNGDQEPDFFIHLKSHHEEPVYELIMSGKTKSGQPDWIRVARFREWS